MRVTTRRSGVIEVEWPPAGRPGQWLLGASADGRELVAYRAGRRGWQAVDWEELRGRATAARRSRRR